MGRWRLVALQIGFPVQLVASELVNSEVRSQDAIAKQFLFYCMLMHVSRLAIWQQKPRIHIEIVNEEVL